MLFIDALVGFCVYLFTRQRAKLRECRVCGYGVHERAICVRQIARLGFDHDPIFFKRIDDVLENLVGDGRVINFEISRYGIKVMRRRCGFRCDRLAAAKLQR